MTAKNQSNDLNAIKTSLLKIAQDIGQPAVQAPGQVAAPAAEGSPEQVLGLIDDAIEVLEVAAETVPVEAGGQAPAPAVAKSKIAQDDDDDDKKKEAGVHVDDDKKKEAADDNDEDTEKEKELKARIAALEDDKEKEDKEKTAKEFVQLYPESIRQAKFDAIMSSDVKSEILVEQFKVAQDLSEARIDANNSYVPATNQSGYLFKKASLNKTLPSWRT